MGVCMYMYLLVCPNACLFVKDYTTYFYVSFILQIIIGVDRKCDDGWQAW